MPAARLRPFWSAIAVHAGLAPDDVQGAMDYQRSLVGEGQRDPAADTECSICRQRFDAYKDDLFMTTIEAGGDERVGGSCFCRACATMTTGMLDGKGRPES
jgi:hypothetical protein